MSEVPFHLTRMGARYYENTLPELLRQVTRLADAVERLADLQVQAGSQHPDEATETDHDEEGLCQEK